MLNKAHNEFAHICNKLHAEFRQKHKIETRNNNMQTDDIVHTSFEIVSPNRGFGRRSILEMSEFISKMQLGGQTKKALELDPQP